METTGDPKESGKGEGEAEALTRDEGGREGPSAGMQADSLNEWRGGWRTEDGGGKGRGRRRARALHPPTLRGCHGGLSDRN
ncbi:hypothetical protein EYF80_022110 [Liparis tanakae]|uniref:Uncharacterized protein n=1 Tax=Liparis tanakae TaxID=230148 RepID=A0A4Z2HP70_9TELE|nr:hypothetical protein EYF80_022110 [Liparis tanakae]